MALVRWLYRRRKVFFFLLCASSFWVAYLYLSLPSNKDRHITHEGRSAIIGKSIPVANQQTIPTTRLNTLKKRVEHQATTLKHLSVGRTEGKAKIVLSHSDTKTENKTKTEYKWRNIGGQLKNKTLEIGEKFKNKTLEVAETVKNKTLEHLAVFGVGKKLNPVRFIFEPHRWNLTVSFEDIGNIMKDTAFLSKLQPLDLLSPTLSSSKNRTSNYTYNMPFHVGFCDCFEHNCVCCARIVNKRLHLNTTTCTNFTFVSKSQELGLQVMLDSKLVYKNTISADSPPLVCLGTYPKVVDICVHFFNMTFKVNAYNEHKTQLLGCTDFSLNVYNKTVGSYPVDCFQIPGDPNHKHKDRLNLFNIHNWMP